MTKFQIILLTGISVLASPIPALAQEGDDVVIMRRVVAPKKITSPGEYLPIDGEETSRPFWAATSWNMGAPSCREDASGTRSVACISNGDVVSDAQCTGTKPPSSIVTADYRTCEYDWRTSSTGSWDATCSMATRSIVSNCTKKSDNSVVSDSFCMGEKPQSETKFNGEGCSYDWAAENEQACPVVYNCVRSDGSSAGDALCTSPKPSSGSCGFTWKPSEWTSDNPGCGSNIPQSRTLSCVDSNNATVSNSLCAGVTPPATTQLGSDYSSCSFSWATGDWFPWSSQCSQNSTRERAVTCMRSDGTVAPNDSDCSGQKPDEEETEENYSGCTFDWSVSEWSNVAACGANATRTRTVTCRRSDGSSADESNCSAQKPVNSETVEDYSSCSYSWKSTPYTWDSTCSDNATGTRSVTCHRGDEDDTLVADSFCDSGNRPSSAVVDQNISGCSTQWTAGEWSAWSSTCSANASRFRSAQCAKMLPSGPAPVDSNQCDIADRPTLSETAGNYSACAPYWQEGTWGWNGTVGAKSSSCSATPQQNRTVQCMKVNTSGVAEVVADGQCNAGDKPNGTVTLAADYSSCSYSWSPNDETTGWGAWSSACSSTATRTRTVNCMRSGTTPVDDSFCASAGTKPSTSQTGTSMGGCTNILTNGNFEDTVYVNTFPPGKGWFYYAGGATGVSNDAFEGSRSVFLNSNTGALFSRNMTSEAVTYGFSMMCKSPQSGQVRVSYSNATRQNEAVRDVTCGPTWTLIAFDMNWTNSGALSMSISSRTPGATLVIDDVKLTPK